VKRPGGISMDELFRFDLQRFADGGDPDGGMDTENSVQDTGDGGQGQPEPTGNTDKGGKVFTQEEVDAIIAKRLARERKAWEQQLEEERKKAQMTEAERLKAETEEAERRAKEAEAAANRRLVQAEARVQAAALGIPIERIARAIKLADLSEVEVSDSGEPDAKAVRAAIEAVLEEIPELKGSAVPAK